MNKVIYFLFTLLLSVSYAKGQTHEELFEKALDYIESKDYENAESSLKQALKQEPANPTNSLLFMNLGTVQRNLGKYDEALVSYSAAMDKFPNKNKLLHSRAALLCEMGLYDDALADYGTILESDAIDKEALYSRALIYMANNDLEKAQNDFDKILMLSINNWQALEGKAIILKRQGKWSEAEELLTDAVFNNKSRGNLYAHRAECHVALGQLGRAQEDLQKATELKYEEPFLYIVWGKLRLQQYDKRAAKESFMKAKELGANEKMIEELLIYCK